MSLSQAERSNYFKGLLILAGRDRIIDAREREMLLKIGSTLNFDPRFCNAAMDDLLRNKYITRDPVIFSDPALARCFLRDAIRLALVDDEVHHHEYVWLKNLARDHGIPEGWLEAELSAFHQGDRSLEPLKYLEIRRFLEEPSPAP